MTCRTLTALVLTIELLVSNGALAQEKVARYRELPYGAIQFGREQFNFEPDPWQAEVLIAFADPKIQRISLQACAGPGKTAVESVCGWYFLGTQATPNEYPKGLCTSVTKENLRDNLWAEFAKWQSISPWLSYAFTHSNTRIFSNDNPSTWFLGARTWPKTGNADEQGRTFSGLHGRNVLIIVDESGSIPPTVLRAAEQALSTGPTFGKILQGGNPISLEGMLHEAANRLRHQWKIIRITGDPDDPKAWVHSPRVANVPEGSQTPAEWAALQIATYGRDNPWVKSYILGEFPAVSINALLGIEDVEKAMARELTEDQYDWAQKRLGVDVARFGDDRTIIFPRQGLAAFNPVTMRNARTTDIAARVAQAIAKWGAEATFLDDTGHWGHGVLDQLHVAGLPCVPVVFHAKALNPRYKNRRAEMWIEMAEAIKGGLALPDIPELVSELTSATYTFDKGVFMLSDKDIIKKLIGRSPDLADGLALTYAIPDQPNEVMQRLADAGIGIQGTHVNKVAIEYDPFAEGRR